MWSDLDVLAGVFDCALIISIHETESAPDARIDVDVRDRPRRRREEPSCGKRRIEPRVKDTLRPRIETPREPQRSVRAGVRSRSARSPTRVTRHVLGDPLACNRERFFRSGLRFHFACSVLIVARRGVMRRPVARSLHRSAVCRRRASGSCPAAVSGRPLPSSCPRRAPFETAR